MKGIQLSGHGNADEFVRLVDVPAPGAPKADEVIIEIEAASVEPSDLYVVAGRYGVLPELPHLLGIQGVGRVIAKGKDVKYLKEGDRTITPPFLPSWVEQVKTNASWLRPLPAGDINQLAMLAINPATSYLLLTEFVTLKPGDWILQNAATSSVGRGVITISKARGYQTVNVVRRPEMVEEIKKLGGDIVLVEGPDLPQQVAAATGKAPIKLALDGVGDTATQNLLNSLPLYGTLLVWSGMSGKPMSASGPLLLFADQTIRGFWIYNWFRELNEKKVIAMYAELAPLVASGALSFPVAGVYDFSQYAEAMKVAGNYSGKAILKPKL